MPSLQTALPPELANNAIRLYRECLRRAKYVGHKQYNTELIVNMIKQQFKKHMHETDPERIQKYKDETKMCSLIPDLDVLIKLWKGASAGNFPKHLSAARGLINHMLLESEQMSSRKFSKSS